MNLILKIIYLILRLYSEALLIRVVFYFLCDYNVINISNSFVKLIGQFLYRVTEPILNPIRQAIPPLKGNFGSSVDLSPMIVLIIIYVLQYFLNSIIFWDTII